MRALALMMCVFALSAGYGCSCGVPAAEGEGEGEGDAGEGEGEGDAGEGEGEGEGEGDTVAPVVTITAPNDGTAFPQGASIVFTCTAVDAVDGDIQNADIDWSSDVDGHIGTGATVQNALVTAGAHVITCAATDAAGNVGTDTVNINITANTLPTVSITSPADQTFFLPSETINFTGAANDAEDGALTGASLVWTDVVNNGAPTSLGAGGAVSTALALGDHVVTLTATDLAGTTASSTITVHVVNNVPPVCTISVPADGTSVVEGDSVTFTANCVDRDGGGALIANQDYHWTSDMPSLASLGFGASVRQALVDVGSFTVTVCAPDITDPANVTGCASVAVTVQPNLPPVVTINSPADGASFNACDFPITLSCNAADPNGGQSVTFRWLDNGTEIATSRTLQDYTPATAGDHVLTCEATDNLLAQGTQAATVHVTSPGARINTPQNGDVIALGDNTRFSGQGCSLDVRDLPGADLTWTSSLDGALGTGNTVFHALSAGQHTITLTVNDAGSIATDVVIVTVNNAPVVTITQPSNGDVLDAAASATFIGTANDVEDGAIGVTPWVDSQNGLLGSTNSLTASGLLVGKHTVTLSATDSAGITSTDTASFFVTPGAAAFSTLLNTRGLNASVNELVFDATSSTLWAATSAGVDDVALDLTGANNFDTGNSDIPGDTVNAVAVYTDGSLMVASTNGLGFGCDLSLQNCQNFQDGDLALSSDNIRAIAVLDDGRTVVGTSQCLMFSDWANDAHTRICEGNGGGDRLRNSGILDVAFDPVSGDVWVVTVEGVQTMTPPATGVVANQTVFNDVNIQGNARTVTVAPSGDAWFATSAGAVRHSGNGPDDRFRVQDGMPSDDTRRIAIDVLTINATTHEIAWVATAGGLGRIDAAIPSVVAITTADGLPTNDCRAIAVLADHTKVVGTATGVFSYAGQ